MHTKANGSLQIATLQSQEILQALWSQLNIYNYPTDAIK
jgi:hypothetical protein